MIHSLSKSIALAATALVVVLGLSGCEKDSVEKGLAGGPDTAGQVSQGANPEGIGFEVIPSSAAAELPSAIGQSIRFQANGGEAPYTWATTAPAVGFIDGTEGTLNEVAWYRVRNAVGENIVLVQDRTGKITQVAVSQTLNEADAILTVSPAAPTIDVPTASAMQFSVSGGTGPFTWTVSAPPLGAISPAGLYTPFNVLGANTITVTDSQGRAGTATVTQE